MLYTVTQTAKQVKSAPSTIRGWAGEFAGYLSDHANPGKGETRFFTDDDILVFSTVKVLRGQGQDYKRVHTALADGQRLEPTETPNELQDSSTTAPTAPTTAPIEQSQALATVDLLERFVNRYEQKIDNLENELSEERDARLDAERRAAAAEAEAAILKEQREEKPRRWFWQR